MPTDGLCPLASLVVPVYAGRQTLPDLVKRCTAIRKGLTGTPAGLLYELIFVCDEPIDDSEAFLLEIARQYNWIQVISLARNSGQHLATAVGILYSSGDWILTLDEDLQHAPELLPQILKQALEHGQDIVYVRSSIRVHVSSGYRDWASRISKWLLNTLTVDDYSVVSSYRLVRGEVARTISSSVDAKSYLDASLFSATSERRRGIFIAEFADHRDAKGSGYSLKKLLRHYGRLIITAEFSGLRLLGAISVLIAIPLAVAMVLLLIAGWLSGAQYLAPGWLSLFSLGILMNISLLVYAIYSLKVLSVLFLRSSGSPPFMVISRELDKAHLAYLRRFT